MIIRWFPPSWLQIKTKGKVIYVDPAWIQSNFTKYPKKIIFSHYPDPMDGLPEPDMDKADAILVTHHHKDHIKVVTIDRLSRKDTEIFAPRRCSKELGRTINIVAPGDIKDLGFANVAVVDAYNTENGNSTKKNHKKGEGVGYLLTIENKAIYHAGDTDFIPEMNGFGKIDIAFLPIGGTYTMDVAEAVEAVNTIKPKVVVPMHYQKTDPLVFKETVEKESFAVARIFQTGEMIEF